jgi:hypothetical protein
MMSSIILSLLSLYPSRINNNFLWIDTNFRFIMNFRFMHIQPGRLNMHRVTGQVLWPLLNSPNGLKPFVLKPNLLFHPSPAKSFYFLSIFLYWDQSAECLNMWSCLRSFLCHVVNLACFEFLNKCFKRGIIGKYHITFVSTFVILWGVPSRAPESSSLWIL